MVLSMLIADTFPQTEQRQHIRQYHQGVDQIGAFPDKLHGDDGSQIDHDDVEKLIERNTFVSRKVFRCFFTEIRLADQCGHGEGAQRDSQESISHVRQMCESGGCQSRFGYISD